MPGKCLNGVWWVSRRCLEGVCKVSGTCLEGVWKVSGGQIRQLGQFRQQKIWDFFFVGGESVKTFWGPNFLGFQIF